MHAKDYTLIASVLRQHAATKKLCEAMGKAMANDNPRFKMQTWMSACGYTHKEQEVITTLPGSHLYEGVSVSFYTTQTGTERVNLRFPDGRHTTMPLARYKCELALGRKLAPDEEVVFKDGDKTNTLFDNMFIIKKV